jgi:hypothetical protein
MKFNIFLNIKKKEEEEKNNQVYPLPQSFQIPLNLPPPHQTMISSFVFDFKTKHPLHAEAATQSPRKPSYCLLL